MNIGYFTDTYRPQKNGVVVSIDLFRDQLRSQGHEVDVFAPDLDALDPLAHNSDDEHIHRVRALRSISIKEFPLAVPLSLKTSAIVSDLDLDIIHSHDPFTLGMYADLVATTKKIPLIHTYHTMYAEYAFYLFRRDMAVTKNLTKKFTNAYCRRADHIITPSEKLKRVLKEYGVKRPITTIPTGIDLETFRAPATPWLRKWIAQKGHSEQAKIALFVGRLGKEKDVEFLVRATSDLPEDSVFVIIGDGRDRPDLEAAAANNPKILFAGEHTRKRVISAYHESDLFLFASLTDTQAIVLLEAAAAGIPTIMRDDPGLTDVVLHDHTGIITPQDVTEQEFGSWVQAMLNNDEQRIALGKAAKHRAESLSIEKQTQKLLNLYEQVIADHTTRAWKTDFWNAVKTRSRRASEQD